jgi:hypothetical protein
MRLASSPNSSDLLAVDGWKAERQKVIVGHGGGGAPRSQQRVGFSNRILRQIKSLRYFRYPKSASVVNTMGSYVRDFKLKAS